MIFTSAGVIFGELGWLWRGSRVGDLKKIWFEGQAPVRLVLKFRRRGRTTELVLPCPAGMEKDLRELVEILKAKTTKVRAKKQVDVPRPKA